MISCKQCILTSNDDPKIELDAKGICNHCNLYADEVRLFLKQGKEGEDLFNSSIQLIKNYGKDKKYDCLIGISGGVDSSYVAYLAHKAGLIVFFAICPACATLGFCVCELQSRAYY